MSPISDVWDGRGLRLPLVCFAKNDRANLNAEELAAYRKAARITLGLSRRELDIEVEAGRLMEVRDGGEDL